MSTRTTRSTTLKQRLAEAEAKLDDAKTAYNSSSETVNNIRQEIRNEKMTKLKQFRAQMEKLEKEIRDLDGPDSEENNPVSPSDDAKFVLIYRCKNHSWVQSTSAHHECPNCECICSEVSTLRL